MVLLYFSDVYSSWAGYYLEDNIYGLHVCCFIKIMYICLNITGKICLNNPKYYLDILHMKLLPLSDHKRKRSEL